MGTEFDSSEEDEIRQYSSDQAADGFESVSTGEVNKTHWLDPDAADWGAAVNDKLAQMAVGDTLAVPPVDYETDTTAIIDKRIALVGQSKATRAGPQNNPTITKTSDVQIIETAESTSLIASGLEFDTAVADTTGGIKVRQASYLENISGKGLGGHLISLAQETTNDNLNLSQVQNVSGKGISGDVVHIENTSTGANNINSVQVSVNDANNCTGWAINSVGNAANASVFEVNTLQEGSNTMAGGIRLDSQKNRATVQRAEITNEAISFEQPGNFGTVQYHTGGRTAAMSWVNSNNVGLYTGGNGLYYQDDYGKLNLDTGVSVKHGADFQGPATFADDAKLTTRASDPGTGALGDGKTMIYVSDGTTDVTGADGDVVVAVNSGGTIKTKILADFSAL